MLRRRRPTRLRDNLTLAESEPDGRLRSATIATGVDQWTDTKKKSRHAADQWTGTLTVGPISSGRLSNDQ